MRPTPHYRDDALGRAMDARLSAPTRTEIAHDPTNACRRYGCWPNRTTGYCNRCARPAR